MNNIRHLFIFISQNISGHLKEAADSIISYQIIGIPIIENL
jgi:hypothetical protein